MSTDSDFIGDSDILLLAALGDKVDYYQVVGICRPLVRDIKWEGEILFRMGFEDDVSLIATTDESVVYRIEYLYATC